MKNVKLLDCTLRDGGYVNDWNFGHDNLVSMFERLVSAGIDIIEVGFLDERRKFDINRSIMPDTACAQKIYGAVDKKQAMVIGMIDFGTCGIENIQPCKDSYLDGIRVIFKKNFMSQALPFCKQIKELGYKVFAQLVSITSYSDEELMELIELVNDVKPYAVSMVDTYGLFHQDSMMHYFNILDKYVLPEIGIGYHSHNNFQMGYANCIEYLKTETNREVVADATLYGMGKSAGNAPIELLAMHMNNKYGKQYDMSQILEAIDGNVMQIYKEKPWGYNLFYYLAASNNCHPNYVKYLMDKHTLSMKSINELLNSIREEKKLLYDIEHIEQLYYDYQNQECDDKSEICELTNRFAGKNILLLGPGKNIQLQSGRISDFIEKENPIVISTNYIPGAFHVDYVFLSNTRRYIRLTNALRECKNKAVEIIATSNVTETNGEFNFTLNNSALIDQKAEMIDNSFVMLLKVMQETGVQKVTCAGFDGYSEEEENYFDPQMEYWFVRRKAKSMNEYVKKTLIDFSNNLKVSFLTDSYYKD